MHCYNTSYSRAELANGILQTFVENSGLSGRITRYYHHLALHVCLLSIRGHCYCICT
jgi:hypothetical protein